MAGGREAIARVVACSANHNRTLPNEPGDLPSGGFHQPIGGDAKTLFAERVDLLDLAAAKSG